MKTGKRAMAAYLSLAVTTKGIFLMTRTNNTIRYFSTLKRHGVAKGLRLIIAVGLVLSVSTAAQASLNDNLLAYWKFDETSGDTAFDSSGNGKHATFSDTGNASWKTTGGKLGGAVDLDGVNDFFTVSGGLAITNQSFSTSYWVKLGRAREQYVLGQGDIGTFSQALHIGIKDSTGKATFAFYADDLTVSNAKARDTANYHHYVATFDAGTDKQTLYIDGAVAGSRTTARGAFLGSGAGLNDFWIGRRWTAEPYHFDGLVDEVAVWNRVLSSTEVTALYNGGAGLEIPIPVATPGTLICVK